LGVDPLLGWIFFFFEGIIWGETTNCSWYRYNYVIAYAIVEVENKENWKWFLSLLDADVGPYGQRGLNFMSDMQKVRREL